MFKSKYQYSVSITYRCGCKETRMEGGNKHDRASLVYRLSRMDCYQCSEKRGGKEVFVIDGEQFTIPALLGGTDKQKEWAVKIRKRIITALVKNCHPGEKPLLWFSRHTSSTWWINHREDKIAAIVQELKQPA